MTETLLTESIEALAALIIAEENWNKMINETVANSGQFQQECEKDFNQTK